MKTLTKLSLVAIAALSSALTQAAVTSASIPLSLTVAKQCTISDVAANIVIPTDASKGTGTFTVTCNAQSYTLVITTANTRNPATFVYTSNPTHILNTQISVDTQGMIVPVNSGALSKLALSSDIYNVNVALINPISQTTPAGVYSDTLNITVDY